MPYPNVLGVALADDVDATFELQDEYRRRDAAEIPTRLLRIAEEIVVEVNGEEADVLVYDIHRALVRD